MAIWWLRDRSEQDRSKTSRSSRCERCHFQHPPRRPRPRSCRRAKRIRSAHQRGQCAINPPTMSSSQGRRRQRRVAPTCSNDEKNSPRQRVATQGGWKSDVSDSLGVLNFCVSRIGESPSFIVVSGGETPCPCPNLPQTQHAKSGKLGSVTTRIQQNCTGSVRSWQLSPGGATPCKTSNVC